VSANELPDGFVADEVPTGINEAGPEQLLPPADFQSPPSGPRFQPYSELKPVRQAPLEYPSRALQGSEGSIDVEFTVTETGRVIDVSVTGEAPAIFLREAARTIRSWRFVPVRQDGEAVPVRTTLRVTYRS
jgi:TonB family protein